MTSAKSTASWAIGAGVASAMFTALLNPAQAQETGAPKCQITGEQARADFSLPRTALKLFTGQPVTIVALGSSSTAGAGATSEENKYPAQLQARLREEFPAAAITVINHGVNGDTVAEMMERLEKTIFDQKPDLIIFQVGTNTLLRDQSLDAAEARIADAIRKMRDRGIDVILMDPQYTEAVKVKGPNTQKLVGMLARLAKRFDIGNFQRYALMRHWEQAQGIAMDRFSDPDKLHMNDFAYACIAQALRLQIANAVRQPIGSGGAVAFGFTYEP